MGKIKTRLLSDSFWLSSGILIILISLFVGVKFYPQWQQKQKKRLLTHSPEQITKIEIQHNNQNTILIKENQQWLVKSEENLPADLSKINDLLEKLAKLTPALEVSRNAANHSRYGVDEKNAIVVKAYKNDQLVLHLLIGNAGPDFESDYLRFPGKDTVYLTNLPLRTILITPSWKNLTITNLTINQITKIIIQKKGKETVYQEQQKPFTELRSLLANLTAEDAYPRPQVLPPVAFVIELKNNDQTLARLSFAYTSDGKHLQCWQKEEKVIYRLSSYLTQEIKKTLKV